MGQRHAGGDEALSGRSGMAVEADSRFPSADQTRIRPQPRSPAQSGKCDDKCASGGRSEGRGETYPAGKQPSPLAGTRASQFSLEPISGMPVLRLLVKWGVAVEKLLLAKFAKIKRVRMRYKRSSRAGRHFLSPNFSLFLKKTTFSTATGYFDNCQNFGHLALMWPLGV